ncbi:MAG TPA: NAD(P)H-dependent oxidoreductase [Crocinitomicaceae bacterium]|nr:NAD(P)H-dependent oxidoreductase [Crocinitomicaceae bacterium]
MNKIIDDLNWRYATKKFDATKKINDADFEIIKESLRLVPSSYGLQPLKFIIVNDIDLRNQLIPASYGQTQVKDASHLIVICAANKMGDSEVDEHIENIATTRDQDAENIKGYGDFMKSTIARMTAPQKSAWNSKQAYIALGQLLHTCATMRIDATPMEGFDPASFSQILQISDNYSPVLLCPIGYRDQEDETQHFKKVRKSQEHIFEKK